MMDKPKRKHDAPSPLAYWWNRFLFARGFDFETTLTPDECADRLRAQSRRASGYLDDLIITSDISLVTGEIYDFDIRIKRQKHRRGIDYTNARATGTIVIDGATGITIVRGGVRFGVFSHPFHWIALGLGMTISLLATPAPDNTSLYWITGIVAICTFLSWRTFRDRQHLIRLIHDTVTDEKSKREP